MDSPRQNLEECRFLFMQGSEIAIWMADVELGADGCIREARLRRTWHTVKQLATLRESGRARPDMVDLDEMLDDVSSREVKAGSRKCYKLRFPADITPSSALVGSCHREMDRGMLMVFNAWQARNLRHQVTSSQKERKIVDSLFVVDAVEEEAPQETGNQYLDQLYTYLLSLAIARAQKAPRCPGVGEGLGAESTNYVGVPLDLLQAYFGRARRTSQCGPEQARLGWLGRLDTEGRAPS